jgi:hypothetical protein
VCVASIAHGTNLARSEEARHRHHHRRIVGVVVGGGGAAAITTISSPSPSSSSSSSSPSSSSSSSSFTSPDRSERLALDVGGPVQDLTSAEAAHHQGTARCSATSPCEVGLRVRLHLPYPTPRPANAPHMSAHPTPLWPLRIMNVVQILMTRSRYHMTVYRSQNVVLVNLSQSRTSDADNDIPEVVPTSASAELREKAWRRKRSPELSSSGAMSRDSAPDGRSTCTMCRTT